MKRAGLLSSVVLGSLFTVAFIACSGSDESVFDPKPAAQTETPTPDPNGNFFVDAGNDVANRPRTCGPAEMDQWKPAWKPPTEFGQNVCSPAQIQAYYDACLAVPSTSPECTKFKNESASCAKCLGTQDTDAQHGPIIWQEGITYYTVNLAGCIARSLGDISPTGCGAAYGAAVECRREACEACFQIQEPSYAKFSECQSNAGKTVCKPLSDAWKTKCPDVRSGASAKCFPPDNATAKDAYLTLAPIFCGAK